MNDEESDSDSDVSSSSDSEDDNKKVQRETFKQEKLLGRDKDAEKLAKRVEESSAESSSSSDDEDKATYCTNPMV